MGAPRPEAICGWHACPAAHRVGAQPWSRFRNRILFSNGHARVPLYIGLLTFANNTLTSPSPQLTAPSYPSAHRPPIPSPPTAALASRPPRRPRRLRLRQRQTRPIAQRHRKSALRQPTKRTNTNSIPRGIQRRHHDLQRPWPPYTVLRSPAITPQPPPRPSLSRTPIRPFAKPIECSSSSRRRLRHNSRRWRKRRVQTSSNNSSRDRPYRTSLP